MMRRLGLIVPIMMLLVGTTLAQQKRWFELYDEAMQHVRLSEWRLAEDKLNQAKKTGPAPGRTVLRYGMFRDDYFPDFYLGVVYLNTNRPKDALAQFQLARSQKLNLGDREFMPIVDFEGRAQREVQLLAANAVPKPVPTGGGGNPPGGGDAPTGGGVSPAGGGGAPPDPGIEALRQLDLQFEQAIRNRSVPGARSALAEIQKIDTAQKAIATYTARVGTLDREIRMAASERSAMRAFFSGDYQQTVSALNAIEQDLGTPLSPRGYFYRACGLAAQALRMAPADGKALAEARRQYAEAMKNREIIAPDRRYVSPRILQVLGS